MDRDSWHQVRELFDAVCELPATQWRTELAQMSADPAVIAETLELLEAQTVDLGRAREPIERLLAAVIETELNVGDRLGPWRLSERLASGGMGVVFRAERADELYDQDVAIKFLQGTANARVAERLAAERRILASLQHPNIARLYDGGATPGGHPYLVMEYVHGQPLDVYCRQHQLGLNERLQLFLKVCGAVQVAHARLVLHCDLKPSNILVRADGEPVLLDFGISRLLGDAVSEGQSPFFTPAYAAPELQRGDLTGVASDVFSLGVILAELCADTSARRAGDGSATAVLAPSRLVDSNCAWQRKLRGDIDAIVTRASALPPEARYPSVEALAADVQRHLSHQPVHAGNGGRFYRGRKLLRRRWKESVTVLAMLVVVSGFVWRLSEARAAAEREALISEQVSAFLVSMFEAADPRERGSRGGEKITAEEVLDRAAASVDQKLGTAPEVRARLKGVIGLAYRSMGDVPRAQPMMLAAAEALAAKGGDKNIDEAARLLNLLAGSYASDRDGVAGEKMARRALALLGKGKQDSLRIAQAHNSLGLSLLAEQRYDGAEVAFKQALKQHEAERRDELIGVSLDNLGMLYRRKGDLAASAAAFERSTPMFKQMFGEMSYDYWASNTERGLMIADSGRMDEAIALFEANLARAPKIFGEHSVYVSSENNRLAMTLVRSGHYRKARSFIAESLRLTAEVMGSSSYSYSLALETAAMLAAASGDISAAERDYRQVLAIREAKLGSNHPDTLDAVLQLGLLLTRQAAPDADALLQRAYAGWMPRIPADSANGIRLRQGWAEWLLAQGRLPEAAATLAELTPVARASSPHAAIQQQWLLAMLAQQGGATASEKVAPWQQLVVDAEQLYGADSALTAQWRLALAEALSQAGDNAAAAHQIKRARARLRAEMLEDSPWLTRMRALGG